MSVCTVNAAKLHLSVYDGESRMREGDGKGGVYR